MKTAKIQVVGGVFLLTVMIFITCDLIGAQSNTNVIRSEREVAFFNAIDVSGAFEVTLKQGGTQSVVVEADENLMDRIETRVKGQRLYIGLRGPVVHWKVLKVFITVSELKEIEISGAVDLTSEGKLTQSALLYSGSGASHAFMDLTVEKLALDCSGSSKVRLSGIAKNLDLEASGAAEISAFDMPVESCNISISGAGSADIQVAKSLSVDISGAGKVRYKGSPKKDFRNITGAGTVTKVD